MKKTAVALQQLPVRFVPESGQIVGGKLHHWFYGHALINIEGDREVVSMKVTPPGWPFPAMDRVTLGPGQFRGLKPSAARTPSTGVADQVRLIQKARDASTGH